MAVVLSPSSSADATLRHSRMAEEMMAKPARSIAPETAESCVTVVGAIGTLFKGGDDRAELASGPLQAVEDLALVASERQRGAADPVLAGAHGQAD